MANKTFEITVRLVVDESVDINDAVSEMDYGFKYPGIIDTEIVGGPDNIKEAK